MAGKLTYVIIYFLSNGTLKFTQHRLNIRLWNSLHTFSLSPAISFQIF